MNEDNVIELHAFKPKQPEWVWECECTGQLFYLNRDGTIQCRSCTRVRETIRWGYRE